MASKVEIVIVGTDRSDRAVRSAVQGAKKVTDATDDTTKAAEKADAATDGLADTLRKVGEGAGKAATETTAAADGAKKLGDSAKGAGDDAGTAAKGVDDLGDAAKKTRDDLGGLGDETEQTESRFKGLGEVAGGILAADVLSSIADRAAQFLHNMTTAASNLSESINAVQVVFKSSSPEIEEWGRTNAAAFGLSQRAFNDLAVPLGAFLQNVGFDMNEVTDHTVRLTQRAADMASVFNTDVPTALAAIQAGLRGESDPLEQFGVKLNAAAIEARALADTGKSTAAALTEQEKAAATLAIIYDQTAVAAGDFAANSDSAANSQRIASAEFENAQAALGDSLLPVLASITTVLADMAGWWADLPGPIQTVTGVVIALGVAILALVPRIAATAAALSSMGITATAVGATLRSVGSFMLGPWGIAITAAIAVTGALVGILSDTEEATDETKRAAADLTATLDKQTGAVTDATRAWVVKELQERGAYDSARTLGISQADLTDAVLGNAEAIGRVNAAYADMHGFMSDGLDDYTEAQGATFALRVIMGDLGGTLVEARQLHADESAALRDQADAAAATREEMAALNDELRKQTDPMFALIEATNAVTEAQNDYNDAVEQYGESSPEAEAASIALAQAALDLQAAAGEAAGAFDGSLSPALRAVLEAAGLTEAQIQDVEDAFEAAAAAGEDFEGTYEANIVTTYTVNGTPRSIYAGTGFTPTSYATGGVVSSAATGGVRGNRVLVGEAGPELVDLPFGSTVRPTGQTQSILSSAGGSGPPAHVILDFADAESAFAQMFTRMVKVRGGGDVQVAFGTRGKR